MPGANDHTPAPVVYDEVIAVLHSFKAGKRSLPALRQPLAALEITVLALMWDTALDVKSAHDFNNIIGAHIRPAMKGGPLVLRRPQRNIKGGREPSGQTHMVWVMMGADQFPRVLP